MKKRREGEGVTTFMQRCKINEIIPMVKCEFHAIPDDHEGLCLLHSRQLNKDKENVFTNLIEAKLKEQDFDFRGVFFPGNTRFFIESEFTKESDFSQAAFAGKADFHDSIFKEKVSFYGATFSEDTNFYNIEFEKHVDFSRVRFVKETDFTDAIFKEGALFYKASFLGETEFNGVIFHGNSDFFRATFSGNIFFGIATIKKFINFDEAIIENQLLLDRINWEKKLKIEIAFDASFDNISFTKNGIIRFRDISLSRATFKGTDLRRCWFFNVDWNQVKGRNVIFEELSLNEKEKIWGSYRLKCNIKRNCSQESNSKNKSECPEKSDYARVEECYRYLKLSYEKAGDFKWAGDFHYGEMEMYRRASKWRWFPFYWYNLYWTLSGYGERPSRALGWLAAFLAIFASLLSWAGLEIMDPKHMAAFGDSFFYLLQKVTLQRPTWAEPAGFWGKLTAGLSVLLIPGQAALFLLALRNRLGRRR